MATYQPQKSLRSNVLKKALKAYVVPPFISKYQIRFQYPKPLLRKKAFLLLTTTPYHALPRTTTHYHVLRKRKKFFDNLLIRFQTPKLLLRKKAFLLLTTTPYHALPRTTTHFGKEKGFLTTY